MFRCHFLFAFYFSLFLHFYLYVFSSSFKFKLRAVGTNGMSRSTYTYTRGERKKYSLYGLALFECRTLWMAFPASIHFVTSNFSLGAFISLFTRFYFPFCLLFRSFCCLCDFILLSFPESLISHTHFLLNLHLYFSILCASFPIARAF